VTSGCVLSYGINAAFQSGLLPPVSVLAVSVTTICLPGGDAPELRQIGPGQCVRPDRTPA